MSKTKNLQFINNFYKEAEKEKGEIITPDYITTIYRDNDTGEKKAKIIIEPEYKYYIAKPNIQIDYNHRFFEKSKLDPVITKYNNLLYDIACRTNMKDYYYDCLYTKGMGKELKKLHHINYIFGTNIEICDYYKKIFLDKYNCNKTILTKGFYDIEVDSIDIDGFADEHEAKAPINALSLFLDEIKVMYILLLKNHKNDKFNKYYKNQDKYKEMLLDKYKEDGIKKIKMLFFDKEIDLIKKFFDIINKYKPDFCLAWNARFDIQTILNRIINLNYAPEDICTHPDFRQYPVLCNFYEDNKAQIYGKRGDTLYLSSYTEFLDQMIIYAALRIGRGEKRSYKLNIIAREEVKSEKIDFSEIGSIKTLPYDNYKIFVEYNMKDVLLLHLIEQKNKEVDLMYQWGLMTYTRLSKVLRKSVSLYNAFSAELNKIGYIIGNNINDMKKQNDESINDDIPESNKLDEDTLEDE